MNPNDPKTAPVKDKKTPTPKLTCIVTGATRLTNEDYLKNKAEGPAGSIKSFMNNYVTKDSLKRLRGLEPKAALEMVTAIRKEQGNKPHATAPTDWEFPEITENQIKRILSMNGKQKQISSAPATPAVTTTSKPKAKSRAKSKNSSTPTPADNSGESQEGQSEGAETTEQVNA